ncbi:hypothetical protein HQN60_01790 [Deefgea piscis]|uniref:Oligosaccharide repeat unit polymerase n=1 Tax=Deefgea piscis TaxID=2739061 RepID=A0A6M8SPU6_9NEIS|nr:hypothetical protein [Deefgea piscis]QKJ65570.1 hypothetical protein HQN60_01790 [Deefgea piscis]
MLNAFLIFVAVISVVRMSLDIKKIGVELLFYPFSWLLLFTIAYFAVPAIVVEKISYFYGWYFNDDVIFISKLASLYFSILVFIFYLLCFPRGGKININPIMFSNLRRIVICLSVFIIAYLLFVAKTYGLSSFATLMADGYQGDQSISEDARLKTVAYISIPLIVILVLHAHTTLAISIAMLIAFIDMSQGGRTAALIPIVAVYISFCYVNKKTYLGIALVSSVLLYSVGIFFRPSEITALGEIPPYISAMGEFRETFLTLPYILNKDISGDLLNVPISFLFNFVGPFRFFLMDVFLNPGAVLANHIGRGYGLGLNFLTEAFYYFGYLGVFLTPLILVGFVSFYSLIIERLSGVLRVILIVIFILVGRLILREGFFLNVGLLCYLIFWLAFIPFLGCKIKYILSK